MPTSDDPPIDELLVLLEREARERSRKLEAIGHLPCGFTHNHYPLSEAEEQEDRRIRACWLLATDYESLRALLAGERVPAYKLNQAHLKAHRARTR
jgi:hypothetical protein